ncbi:hypothetical protein ACSSS7_005380 [Eimeria intestinalis]
MSILTAQSSHERLNCFVDDARSLPEVQPKDERLTPYDKTEQSKNKEAGGEEPLRQQNSCTSAFRQRRPPDLSDTTGKKFLTSTDFPGSPNAIQPMTQAIESGPAPRQTHAHTAELHDRSAFLVDYGSEQATQSARKHEDKTLDSSRNSDCAFCCVDSTRTRCSTLDLSYPGSSLPLLERGKLLPAVVRADMLSSGRQQQATSQDAVGNPVTPAQSNSSCEKANVTISREQDYQKQARSFYQDRLELPVGQTPRTELRSQQPIIRVWHPVSAHASSAGKDNLSGSQRKQAGPHEHRLRLQSAGGTAFAEEEGVCDLSPNLQQHETADSGQEANHDSGCRQGLVDEKVNQSSPWKTVLDLEDEEAD